ncbi:MAG: hypothetical protein OEM02_00025 [Desulfobulbaceae bacterium]|nr:hypothetical protein [Desulfobulbaceae bacterium]
MFQDTFNDNKAVPLPWYIHLIGGHGLTGLFPWILVARQFFHRQQKWLAYGVFSINLAIFLGFCYAAIFSHTPWTKHLLWFSVLNFIWSMSGWGCQRYFIGPAPPRYTPFAWKTRLSPFFTALLLTVCYGVILSIFPILKSWGEMAASGDILDKKLLLEDFFLSVPYLLPYGLIVGIYWAGKPKEFSSAHPIAFFAGLNIFYLSLAVVFQLFLFIFFQGNYFHSLTYWPVIAQDPGSLGKFFLKMEQNDQVVIIVVALLLCSVNSIRQFWKKAFFVIPVVCLISVPLAFSSSSLWQLIQGQIFNKMDSPDLSTQREGASWAETLLARYPNHDQWPEIALSLAQIQYENGNIGRAKNIYEAIVQKYPDSTRWRKQTQLAKAALGSEKFGDKTLQKNIVLPKVSYEPYLTPNWMALLQTARYWHGDEVAESQLLIELKSFSKSDEKIDISRIPDGAKLYDNATNLGFQMILIPTDFVKAKALLYADIPILFPIDNEFHLLSGYLDDRSVFKGYGYQHLSTRLKKSHKEEAGEILFLKEEGKGKSEKHLEQVAKQAYMEIPYSYWQSAEQKDKSPYMAIVFPSSKGDEIAKVLNTTLPELTRESKGHLGGLIAFAAFQSADIIRAIEWAQASTRLTNDPFPLHVAHLSEILWKSRDKSSVTGLHLEEQFPQLATIFKFMQSESTRSFLDTAATQFTADLTSQKLSSRIRHHYSDFLDRSSPADLALLENIYQQDLRLDPSDRRTWLKLVEVNEWKGDLEQSVKALQGALEAGAWSDTIALKMVFQLLQINNDLTNAKTLFNKINPAKVKYNADYFYCKGALAERDEETDTALQYYEQAISMRRYTPLYHLEYGKLLMKLGQTKAGRKALQWAISVDDGVGIKEQAEKYLNENNHS